MSARLAEERVCICSDPENCTQRVPGYRCKKDFMPKATDERALFTEVSKEAFFRSIGPLNVSPRVVGNYPYRSDFVTVYGEIKGKIQDGEPDRFYLVRDIA